MKELLAYVEMIKAVLDREYGKDVVFYNNGAWYSKDHGRLISIEELKEFLMEKTDSNKKYREEEYY